MATALIGKAIFARLNAYAGLTALVSSRIYPLEAPQNASLPYVVYQIIDDVPHHAMGADPAIGSPRAQVSALGETYASADAVAAQIKAALQDYQGTVTVGADSMVIQRSFWEGRNPDMAVEDPETQLTVYQVSHDFIIWHD